MADDTTLAAALAAAQEYLRQAKAPNTLRAYLVGWRHFARWCGARGRQALPASPETVALYLTELAGERRVSTLKRRLASLSQAHQAAGWESPAGAGAGAAAVRALMAGIRRANGTAARADKTAAGAGPGEDPGRVAGGPARRPRRRAAAGRIRGGLPALGAGGPGLGGPGVR